MSPDGGGVGAELLHDPGGEDDDVHGGVDGGGDAVFDVRGVGATAEGGVVFDIIESCSFVISYECPGLRKRVEVQ